MAMYWTMGGFNYRQNVHYGFEVHAGFFPLSISSSFLQNGRILKVITHLYLVLRLRTSGVLPPPLYLYDVEHENRLYLKI
jgi:hypothetical protein